MLDNLVWIFKKVNTFPQKQRFVLGQQIENSALNCMRLIVEANDSDSPDFVLDRLKRLNIEIDVLRDLLRIAYEVKFIATKSLGYIVSQIDEVGKMCGSWIKRQKRSLSSKSDN